MRVAASLVVAVFLLAAVGHEPKRIEGRVVRVGHSFALELRGVYRVVPGEAGLPKFSGLNTEYDRLRGQELMLAFLTAPEADPIAIPAEGQESLLLLLDDHSPSDTKRAPASQ